MARRYRAGRGFGVAACGAVMLLWLTGCGSGSGIGPGASHSPTGSGSASASGSQTSGSEPSWAAALGPGVTVVPPGTTPPGHESPGGVMQAVANEVDTGTPEQLCAYFPPSYQPQCRQAEAGQPGEGPNTMQHFALGYVAIDGGHALVGYTATSCLSSGRCYTNSDPAAIFDSGKPFATLWPEAIASENSSTYGYGLSPCVKVGSDWYLYPPSSS